LRWILEILAVLHDSGDPASLAPTVVAAAHREGKTAEVRAALHLVGSVPGGEAVGPINAALESALAQPLSSVRRWVKVRSLPRR
jgi:hypothetical protein